MLGRGGAGKTRFAEDLSKRTGIPVTHLDTIFWRAGWQAAPRDEALAKLERVIAQDEWIIEGSFIDAGDSRFARADTVFFLDTPRLLCVWRVLWRRVRDRGRARGDLPRGARESFDRELFRWIWTYDKSERPEVLARLGSLPPTVDVHVMR